MSQRNQKILSLAGIGVNSISKEELPKYFNEYLKKGIHGICFSAYEDGQQPGTIISEEQVRRRLEILKPYIKWIRTFSCTEGNEWIPKVAKELGIKTMVGAWIGNDKDKNIIEIENLIKLANEGNADLVAVGNEVLYRNDLTEEELLEQIKYVKNKLPNHQVGYVDAYYEFRDRPALTEICDVIFTNCYPFWEGCHIDYSLAYMKSMYQIASKAAKGKRVVISETGWPNIGTNFEGSEPSNDNSMRYFINSQKWCEEDNIEMMYFSSFDEAWKVGDEGDVGAYWGLWDKDGKPKFSSEY